MPVHDTDPEQVIRDAEARQSAAGKMKGDFNKYWADTLKTQLTNLGVFRADMPSHEHAAWLAFKEGRKAVTTILILAYLMLCGCDVKQRPSEEDAYQDVFNAGFKAGAITFQGETENNITASLRKFQKSGRQEDLIPDVPTIFEAETNWNSFVTSNKTWKATF